MKLSTRKLSVKDPRKLKYVLEDEKINKALDVILEKVKSNPEGLLSPEETELLKNNVGKLQAAKDYWVMMMIRATGDKEFIKSCLEDEKFEFDEHSKQELIIAVHDKEYTKQYVESSEGSMDFKSTLIKSLMTVMDDMDYAAYVTNFVRSKDLEMNPFYKVLLISSVGNHPKMDVDTYMIYLNSRLGDETIALTPANKVELISKLKELESMQAQERSKDGKISLSRYEWNILKYVRENKFGFGEREKSQLIGSSKNMLFYNICLRENGLLDSVGKASLIQQYKNLDNVTVMQYLLAVRDLIQDESLGLENSEKSLLIMSIKAIEELNEKSDQLKVGNEIINISEYDRIVAMAVLDSQKRINLTSNEKASLLSSISNIELINLLIAHPEFAECIDADDKANIILSTNNEEYIKKCIDNKKLFLGFHGRVALIKSLKDKSKIREYIEETEGLLDDEDKVDLMLAVKDEAYIKECLKNSKINLSPVEKARAIIEGIEDEEYRRRCLGDEFFDLDLKAKDMLITAIGTEEEKQEWQARIVEVKDISKISAEELERLPDDAIIKTEDTIYKFYTKQEYLQVRKKMDEILEGIELPKEGDEASELAAFLEISKRIARHISYDKDAISKIAESNHALQKEGRNLYGGLINGKSVCAGYAAILKNALACLGIEAKYVSGSDKKVGTGHAWNQVKIGGVWYNVDLTWERNEIARTGVATREILRSDQEFEDHKKYKIYKETDVEPCTVSMKSKSVSQTHSESRLRRLEKQDKEEI